MKQINVSRRGTLRIVSSGYADRYVAATVWVEIEVEQLRFRIDDLDDAPRAYLMLAGLPDTPQNWSTAHTAVTRAALTTYVTAEILPTAEAALAGMGRTIKTFASNSHRLRAGIAVCTGYPNLNAWGRADADKAAADLTQDEWAAIYSGLDAVNREHVRLGHPVVEFARQQ